MKDTQYFYDGDHFVVSMDGGDDGFFEISLGALEPEWRFVVPGSLRWDALRQDIYWAHHDLDPCPPELQAKLPALPAVPAYKRIDWKDNFLPLEPLDRGNFPETAKALEAAGGRKTYWFVLHEDLYETYHGDGCFHYFNGAVLDCGADAQALAERIEKETAERPEYPGNPEEFVKSFTLTLAGTKLEPLDWQPVWPEDYSIEKIIKRIEEVLSSHGRVAWGEKKSDY